MSANVEALIELLSAAARARLAQVVQSGLGDERPYEGIARFLAAHNVLAIDTLTDEQRIEIRDPIALSRGGGQPTIVTVRGEDLRDALRRIATGEA